MVFRRILLESRTTENICVNRRKKDLTKTN